MIDLKNHMEYAVARERGYKLKAWVPANEHADTFVVQAFTPDGELLVERDARLDGEITSDENAEILENLTNKVISELPTVSGFTSLL